MENFDRPALKSLIGKKDLVGAEIGVDSGINANHILQNLDIKKLYLIDVWAVYGNMCGSGVIPTNDKADECFKYARNLLKDYKDKIVWVRDYSWNAGRLIGNGELDFVYIDANHRYEYVKKDIELYYPKVKLGGLIAGHDFKGGEPGVKKAVEEFCKLLNKKAFIGNWDWWVKKGE